MDAVGWVGAGASGGGAPDAKFTVSLSIPMPSVIEPPPLRSMYRTTCTAVVAASVEAASVEAAAPPKR